MAANILNQTSGPNMKTGKDSRSVSCMINFPLEALIFRGCFKVSLVIYVNFLHMMCADHFQYLRWLLDVYLEQQFINLAVGLSPLQSGE